MPFRMLIRFERVNADWKEIIRDRILANAALFGLGSIQSCPIKAHYELSIDGFGERRDYFEDSDQMEKMVAVKCPKFKCIQNIFLNFDLFEHIEHLNLVFRKLEELATLDSFFSRSKMQMTCLRLVVEKTQKATIRVLTKVLDHCVILNHLKIRILNLLQPILNDEKKVFLAAIGKQNALTQLHIKIGH